MITWADLLLKLYSAIFDTKGKLKALKRDKRDRIAQYFDQVSQTLAAAAAAFAESDRPWDKVREVEYYLTGFVEIAQGALENDDKILLLRNELHRALYSDYQLLMNSRERNIVDVITVRPEGREYDSKWDENPVRSLTEDELKKVIEREAATIRSVSGLFKAVAVELRATE